MRKVGTFLRHDLHDRTVLGSYYLERLTGNLTHVLVVSRRCVPAFVLKAFGRGHREPDLLGRSSLPASDGVSTPFRR